MVAPLIRAALLLSTLAPVAASAALPSKAEASLDQRIAAVLPTGSEDRWLEVQWRTSLLRARREANDTGRPMLMWLMDGDPLGGT